MPTGDKTQDRNVSRRIHSISSREAVPSPTHLRRAHYDRFSAGMDEGQLGELFSRIGRGDEIAEGEFCDLVHVKLRAVAFSRGFAGCDVDDLLQDVLSA